MSPLIFVALVVQLLVLLLFPVASPCYLYPPGVRDPCNNRRCSYGARCTASLDGLSARCQCPQRCDQYGDTVESVAVCASDGREYPSTCDMELTACREMRPIDRRYDSPCDPCDGFASCRPTEVCQLDDSRQPVCRCNDDCARQVDPICGTDGRTYRNECHMQLQACRLRHDVGVLHRGKCQTGKSTDVIINGDFIH